MRGSSPRGRGKRVNERSAPNRPGLIPAWAGKTDTPTRLAAHVPGSSPRGRGKRVEGGGRQRCQRLIPAWAGKTRGYGRADRGLTAHPRVGGENSGTPIGGVPPLGSSPRGRGKLAISLAADYKLGLIPAWAGKTRPASGTGRAGAAHPRVGGENMVTVTGWPVGSGSSPRGRGKPLANRAISFLVRLIPAWAGKTCPRRRRRTDGRAHPRVGGENRCTCGGPISMRGSSPRGRGKPGARGLSASREGLIPAWAGKTLNPATVVGFDKAHPRVGGENSAPATATRRPSGSSPRGRGKRIALTPRV